MEKNLFILIFFVFYAPLAIAQEIIVKEVDSLYKEDQFYAGVTYNLIGNIPKDLKQNGFSLGFHAGFIKDIPINKDRDIAIGIGFGYSANSFNQNLLIMKDADGQFNYSIADESVAPFTRNKFSQHLLELPIEFRWRTSTPEDYRFWRIYAGFKIGYVFINTAKYKGSLGNYKYAYINDFNDFQYGLSLSLGYNTWNLYFYYSLNPIFNSNAQLNGESIDMNAIKIGLMFYIL